MIEIGLNHYLRFLYGFYNFLLFSMVLYQGILGLKIREERKTGKANFFMMRRHRKLRLFLIAGVSLGFCGGIIVSYIINRYIFEYPFHFIIGLLIVISFFVNFFISKKLKRMITHGKRFTYFLVFLLFCYI